jgi:hypothetical protein
MPAAYMSPTALSKYAPPGTSGKTAEPSVPACAEAKRPRENPKTISEVAFGRFIMIWGNRLYYKKYYKKINALPFFLRTR